MNVYYTFGIEKKSIHFYIRSDNQNKELNFPDGQHTSLFTAFHLLHSVISPNISNLTSIIFVTLLENSFKTLFILKNTR